MIIKRFCLYILLLFLLSCSSNNEKVNRSEINNQDSADVMYINAMELFNAKKMDEATIAFDEIDRLYPFSNEAIQAQIMSGFIDYGKLQYDDAIYKFSRIITKNKKLSSEILNIKGRNFEIKNFYEGISRFDFDDLCDQNLGSEDYLKIAENSNFMIIEKIPEFNEINSNQQQRFITLIDIIYDKNVPLAVTAKNSLKKFTSSKSLEEPFKRTISRLYELTSMDFKI